MSSSQPRQDRSYLAEVVFLSLSFGSLDKAHFNSNLLSYPKRAFCGLPACALRTQRRPRLESSGEPRDASLLLQGRPAGSVALVPAPQDAAGKFVHVYAFIGK